MLFVNLYASDSSKLDFVHIIVVVVVVVITIIIIIILARLGVQ